MIIDIDRELILMASGAFVLGWILASIVFGIRNRRRAQRRDKRDDRIRSLEAELRIASTERDQFLGKYEQAREALEDANDSIAKRDNVISHQQTRVEQLKKDLLMHNLP